MKFSCNWHSQNQKIIRFCQQSSYQFMFGMLYPDISGTKALKEEQTIFCHLFISEGEAVFDQWEHV